MGICGSSAPVLTPSEIEEEEKLSKNRLKLETSQLKLRETSQNVRKLLFLGTGESGKSTLFKQMVIHYGNGFSDEEREDYARALARNIIENILIIIRNIDRDETALQISPELDSIKKEILGINVKKIESLDPDLGAKILKMWNDPAVKELIGKSLTIPFLQVQDNVEYLFERLPEMLGEEYVPTDLDILSTRVRTTGIIEEKFELSDKLVQVVDVGGQRNERRKWIGCFQNVSTLVFVIGLSEYNRTVFEARDVNRMDEAVALFKETVNNEAFDDASVLIFFNKIDIFSEMLENVPITEYFTEYTGDGKNIDQICEYVKEFFSKLVTKKKKLMFHFTTATNKEEMKRVLDIVKNEAILATRDEN